MAEAPMPSRCSRCGKPFEEGDEFFYDILDDDPGLDDLCKECAGNITMLASARIQR